MVRMIHGITGNDMYAHESRVEEYKAAGHKPAAEVQPVAGEQKKTPKKRKTAPEK